MLYEIAHLENGEIVRGGIKAPLLTVGKWIRESMKAMNDVPMFAIPANEDAWTEKEFEEWMDSLVDEQVSRG